MDQAVKVESLRLVCNISYCCTCASFESPDLAVMQGWRRVEIPSIFQDRKSHQAWICPGCVIQIVEG